MSNSSDGHEPDKYQKKKIKDMSKEELKEYKRLKQMERRENLTDQQKKEVADKDKMYQATRLNQQRDRMSEARSNRSEEHLQFDNIKSKFTMRKLRKKVNEGDELEGKIEENENEECEDWYNFFMQSEESKRIMEIEIPQIYSKCEALKKKRQEEKLTIEQEEKLNEIEKKRMEENGEICVCEHSDECEFCETQFEDENIFNKQHEFTKEEEKEFEKQELEQYRRHKREERNEKRREKAERARQPMQALPERELCLFERIREDIIAQRKREWAVLENKYEELSENKNNKLSEVDSIEKKLD